MGHQGLKGLLLMAICCGVPLLLFLVFPVFGMALGGRGSSVVNVLALLACPLGMGLMMWFMMRTQQATADQPAHVAPPARSQEPRNAPAEPGPGKRC